MANWLETIKAGLREQLSSLANFSSMHTNRRTLDKFLDIFHTRNMVKRPGLGKRKRVTLPPIEASEDPEQPEQPEQPDELPATQASASDTGDTATQATQPDDTDDFGRGQPRQPVPGEVQEKEAGEDDRWPRG